jgi:hypothetical protein
MGDQLDIVFQLGGQVTTLSSFSVPRITIFSASSDKGLLQRLRLTPGRAHPNVAFFVGG